MRGSIRASSTRSRRAGLARIGAIGAVAQPTDAVSTKRAPPTADAAREPVGVALAERRASGSGVWRRFRRHRLALVGSTILLLLTVGAVGAPIIAQHGPYSIDLSAYRLG